MGLVDAWSALRRASGARWAPGRGSWTGRQQHGTQPEGPLHCPDLLHGNMPTGEPNVPMLAHLMHTATHGIVDPGQAGFARTDNVRMAGRLPCARGIASLWHCAQWALSDRLCYLNSVLRFRHSLMRMKRQFYCREVQKSRTFPWRVRISTRRACFPATATRLTHTVEPDAFIELTRSALFMARAAF